MCFTERLTNCPRTGPGITVATKALMSGTDNDFAPVHGFGFLRPGPVRCCC